ncbi:MAG: hypothetical protein JO267_11880 [Alphaproteobacteria bacterium]|nr:hypothetical protein [Alphaproteobacteria bacterium]
MRSRGLAPALLGAMLALAGAPSGWAQQNPPVDLPIIASADALRDFLTQNVCLDAAGAVLAGISPVDGDMRCVGQRDLLPGEALPYHKHDHPSPGDRDSSPRGYQRSDSFPVETAGLGIVIEHSFDFGSGDGRRFGVFDDGRGDGGDIAIVSSDAADIGATEDGGAGFQLFVGMPCVGDIAAAALRHSWIIAIFDPAHPSPLQGSTVARLLDLKRGRQQACPARFDTAYTSWRLQPVRYRAAPGQGTAFTLPTLISEHYAGSDPAEAMAVERFYLTRELGGTRWESWVGSAGFGSFTKAKVADAAAAFAASGRCSPADPPAGGSPLVMIDCREWTRIEAPDDAAGDRPGFLIDAIRTRPDAPSFFAAPH